ncbi:ornithine carbamoyltransferase [Paenibacillus apiarius]|uniref:Ornithine carbamoyltransferase n=1 Tax=Paenibacillus apiarius TaxID=46240 RepID=A0ABT4DSE4_9BACL|nr:ornithine carbamoyltransferase [Paenibacillus apiarius]MCY9514159.1 ornithine carbamoyltransferase [Paenibacillus apiarius]MCY9520282.1 ornithine carbamoyltransferase [Paenibacillus apiarius]MCY9550376.1 ornithine carbamoyltransferase [Paenibacillus apiarius]MCY9557438.1 ornithine carbamoyltransferase [Paenibacillus apiarius]MCY9682383.1 ornithine carbamoyltransferase [Paenibacillus apiarius]
MTNTQSKIDLRGRDFIALADYTTEEIQYLLDCAIELKQKQKAGEPCQPLKGKTLGMIFGKSSTRTRVSFEVGMYQLGGHALFLSKNDLQLGRGETIFDTAQTMSRYLDGIMIRTYEHHTVIDLARGATIPVINGLTDMNHPCQALADYQTVLEKKGKLQGLKLAYIGDGNNMAHSLMVGASKLGVNVAVASPEGYTPDKDIVKQCKEQAGAFGSNVLVTQDPKEAIADADVVYTDVWASMGFESEQQQREMAFRNFQVNEELTRYAKPDYLFLHCLPAHRGEEVSEGVIDGKHSVIFDQAENRLHAQKAVMAALMG